MFYVDTLTLTKNPDSFSMINPFQVIFKCCKLIPVMVGGIIIQGWQF